MAQSKTISPDSTTRAVIALEQIAMLAARIDRECYHCDGELIGEGVTTEEVELRLDRLRGAICQMGWLADLGRQNLTGEAGGVRGSAEAWLLPPIYPQSVELEPS